MAVPLRSLESQADDPVDAALRAPHSAILVSWALAFAAFLSLLAVVDRAQAHPPSAAAVWITLLLTLAAAGGAILLLAVRRTRTTAAALLGLVLLDAVPPLLQATALSSADARTRVALLILPTMIAAASLPGYFFRSQLLTASGLATIMLLFTSVGSSAWGHVIEIGVAVGVLVAASVMVRRVSAATSRHISDLRRLALTDKLTEVLNRRGLADGFTAMCAGVGGDGSIGVVSIDIDHFKWFNDTYGHAAGDDVLRLVCRVLREAAGQGSLVARTGGEELVALVHGPAEPIAEKFRTALSRTSEPRVTASIGIVDAPIDACRAPGSLWRILDAADKAMYQAKTTGRDRICRGHIDRTATVRPQLAPAPEHAAVPQPAMETVSTSVPLPGWMLTILSLLGVLSGIVRNTAPASSVVGQLYMTIMMTCLILGVVVIGMGPLVDRFRWAVGVIGSDLVVLISAAALDNSSARMVTALPVLLTGLMVAQYFGRRLLLAHHAAIVGIYATAPIPNPMAATVILATFTAAVLIGATELIYFLQMRNRAAAADLHRWSVTDPLTGLANRHGLELGFESLSRAQQLTVLALDVDDFKGINDTYGHAAGDDALIRLAAALRTVTNPDTVVCRTGGDEFVVLAPSMRPSALTSTVKRAAALLPLPLSVSIGSAVAAPHRLRSLWQLVDAADAALIRAKRSRRQQRGVSRPGGAPVLSGPEPVELLGPSDDERAALDDRDFGPCEFDADDQTDVSLVMDRDDGSSGETSTRTTSPSTRDPARSWRAS
jgi:diguanylate cyclase (GGDEF)-like protein